jgi:RNA ligase
MNPNPLSFRYPFPVVHSLDEVAIAIQGRPEFTIKDRKDFLTVGYKHPRSLSFPEVPDYDPREYARDGSDPKSLAILRECRGLAFDRDGVPISRPFHKFFNINERPETDSTLINLAAPHTVLDKLDGQMVRPIPLGDGYRLATKKEISPFSIAAERYVAENPVYDDFIRAQIREGATPIFEWCSPDSEIVLPHQRPSLTLLAIRNVRTGEYLSYERTRLLTEAAWPEIRIVSDARKESSTLQALLTDAATLIEQEGWVIRFEDGHMVKVKTGWYLERFRAADPLNTERALVQLILSEEVDDVRGALLPKQRAKLESFEQDFLTQLRASVDRIAQTFFEGRALVAGDKKRFAVEVVATGTPIERAILFLLWDRPGNPYHLATEWIRRQLESPTKYNQLRSLWKTAELPEDPEG